MSSEPAQQDATFNTGARPPTDEQKNLVLIVYILQALSFLVGVTFIAAVIVDYIKRDELRGTWLESHINWQIRTFWWALLWMVIGTILFVVVVGAVIMFAATVWVIYRIVRGWLAFNDGKELPDGRT